jgi:hypothetical protein
MNISANGQSIVMCDNTNVVYVSTNYGSSFATKTSFPTATTFIYISNDGTYLIGCQNYGSAVYRSSNGGSNWTNITPSGTFTSFNCGLSSTGQYQWFCGSGTNKGIYISSNYGTSFTNTNSGVTTFGGAMTPDGQFLVVAPAYGATTDIKSVNYGVSWANMGSYACPLGGAYEGFHISGNGNVIVKSNYNYSEVFISTNGGTSFSLINSTTANTLRVKAGSEANFAINYDGSAIYSVGNYSYGNGSYGANVDGRIYVSTNNLNTITQLGSLTKLGDNAANGIRASQYGKYLLTFNSGSLYLTTQSSVTES